MDISRKTSRSPLIGVMPGNTLSAPDQVNGSDALHSADLPSTKVSVLNSAVRLATPGNVAAIGRHEMDRHLVTTVRDLVQYELGVSPIGSSPGFYVANLGIRGLAGNGTRSQIDSVAAVDATLGAVRCLSVSMPFFGRQLSVATHEPSIRPISWFAGSSHGDAVAFIAGTVPGGLWWIGWVCQDVMKASAQGQVYERGCKSRGDRHVRANLG